LQEDKGTQILRIEIQKWPAPISDIFPRTVYREEQKLPAAINATGNNIKDVKAVVMGHLHLDHAGGLEHFLGTDVPIYVHEEEFKHACWAVATGADFGIYLADYLNLEKLKWTTFTDDHFYLCRGITLHFSPGHSPGLTVMQVNLNKDGTFIWTSDQFHVAENYELSHPQGWLARDHNAWIRSKGMITQLQRLFNARLIFGHDLNVAKKLIEAKKYYE
jgi:glyoxylase-like metal-dependent hydrolase (beta-lactamase superfamily II)